MTDRVDDKHATGSPAVRRLFDFEQAADFAGVPIQELCYQVRIGKLKVYHFKGGRVRIDEADLIANIQPRELEW